MESENRTLTLVLAAMFLALALVLPFLTGQIPKVGNALCLMHIPVLLCGFICGPWYALAVGFIAPLLRSVLFGMPPLIPKGIAMSFELAAYGLVSGLLYKKLRPSKAGIYVALIGAMIAGRLVWGTVRTILYGMGKSEFGWAAFLSGALFTAIPGIILQIILIPILVMAIEQYRGKRSLLKRANAASAEAAQLAQARAAQAEASNGGLVRDGIQIKEHDTKQESQQEKEQIALSVRRTQEKDIPAVLKLYEAGRAHMRLEGNDVQWAGTDVPENKITDDVAKGISYVVVDEHDVPRGVFAFILGEDPTYRIIEQGAWPDDAPYGTIHRIASDRSCKGILKAAVAFAQTKTDHLRIDTHEKNRTMRNALQKEGFQQAGVIYVSDGTPRLAYYKTRN